MTGWTDEARRAIAAATADLADTASLPERVKAIYEAYPPRFGLRKNYPYKAWLRARRAYLARYGYRGRPTPIESFIQAQAAVR